MHLGLALSEDTLDLILSLAFVIRRMHLGQRLPATKAGSSHSSPVNRHPVHTLCVFLPWL